MDRRTFVAAASATVLTHGLRTARAASSTIKPMSVGLLIKPFGAPEERIKRVHDMGFSNCFFSLDDYLGRFTADLVPMYRDLLEKYEVVATAVEVVGPQPLVWDFLRGPSTIGLVPSETRAARIDALRQASDFAHKLGIGQVQTHCGFIPEDPADQK